MYEARHSVCSKQDIPRVRSRTFLVFEARHSLCSKQDIPRVRTRTFLVMPSYDHHAIIRSHDPMIISSYDHVIKSSSLTFLSHQAPGGSGPGRSWPPCKSALARLVCSPAPAFQKIDELRATFSRFVARTGPLGLDFRSPGRSRARFWRPKRPDFRAFSTLARVRSLLRAKCTKHWQELHF